MVEAAERAAAEVSPALFQSFDNHVSLAIEKGCCTEPFRDEGGGMNSSRLMGQDMLRIAFARLPHQMHPLASASLLAAMCEGSRLYRMSPSRSCVSLSAA